jgi:hypothetical protein
VKYPDHDGIKVDVPSNSAMMPFKLINDKFRYEGKSSWKEEGDNFIIEGDLSGIETPGDQGHGKPKMPAFDMTSHKEREVYLWRLSLTKVKKNLNDKFFVTRDGAIGTFFARDEVEGPKGIQTHVMHYDKITYLHGEVGNKLEFPPESEWVDGLDSFFDSYILNAMLFLVPKKPVKIKYRTSYPLIIEFKGKLGEEYSIVLAPRVNGVDGEEYEFSKFEVVEDLREKSER